MKNFILVSLFTIIVVSGPGFCQEFKPEILISIPGNNFNFCLTSPAMNYPPHDTYICWVNRTEAQYSILLKRIDPFFNNNFTIWSDINPAINPVLSFIPSDSSIKIVWQSMINSRWRLLSRELKDNKLSDIKTITDTLKDCITPSLSDKALVWIENGDKLVYYNFTSSPIIIDSSNCSNPIIFPYTFQIDPTILYEKGDSSDKQIYKAQYIGQIREQKPYWNITKLSEQGNMNINPTYASYSGISYQTRAGNNWKGIYQRFFGMSFHVTGNLIYSIEHPVMFNYPIPSGISEFPYKPYFLVFDSDSIPGNREIFVGFQETFIRQDSVVNISSSPGDDAKPKLAYLNSESGTSSISIIWEHTENGKTDIWWAASPLKLAHSGIGHDGNDNSHFTLMQNYPNPFNPETTINYLIPKESYIELKVFDMLGREVSTLVNGLQGAGEYKVRFDGSTLSSGIYIYTIKAGDYRSVRKLILLK